MTRTITMVLLAALSGCGQDDGQAANAATDAPASGTYDVVETRDFDAPVELVWRAWSEGDRVKEWWGPHGFTVPVADMDFREGGRSLVCMKAPADFGGQLLCNTWTYSRIEPNERIDFVLDFTDDAGNRLDPAAMEGMPPGIPNGVPHEITFRRLDGGRTELRIVERGYTTQQAQETSMAGLDQVMEKLATHLHKR